MHLGERVMILVTRLSLARVATITILEFQIYLDF